MSPTPPKKELSTEVRLLVAFVLMGLVLVVSQYLIKPAPGPAATKTGAEKTAQPVTPAEVEKPAIPIPSTAKQKAEESATQVKAGNEEFMTVDTAVFHVVFSNRGATVR